MRSLLAALLLLVLLPAAARAQTPAPPGAVTRPATDIGHRSATLTAEVDPNGAETTYVFQYGTTTAYGLETEARPAGDGVVAAPVTAPVADLSPSTLYHYRVVATNAEGSTSGEDATFTTTTAPPNPQIPRVFWLRVQANSPTDPVVNATLNPRGAETTWRIE